MGAVLRLCGVIAAYARIDPTTLRLTHMLPVGELRELFQAPGMDLGNLADEAEKVLHDDMEFAYGSVSGDTLLPDLVKNARAEEIAHVWNMGVRDGFPVSECHSATGRRQPLRRGSTQATETVCLRTTAPDWKGASSN